MKEIFKKRLAVFLTLLMILPAIAAVLPIASTEVQAADIYVNWNLAGYGEKPVQVEKGQTFYVGDYVNIYANGISSTASMVKASYSSNKKTVATVNGKGLFTAKKTGTATITIKYKGKKISCKFEVVPAGKFKSSEKISTAAARASELAESIPSKITTKNGFDLLKKVKDYANAMPVSGGGDGDVSRSGFIYTKAGTSGGTAYYSESQQLAVPQAGRYWTLCGMLDAFASKNGPTSTRSAKVMKIKSVTATASAITVKLKKKIDLAQILSAQINERYNTSLKNDGQSKAQLGVYLYDPKTYNPLFGAAVIQKGSNTMKITPKKNVYKNGESKLVTTKLKKGKTYRLENWTSWTKGKTVKVK